MRPWLRGVCDYGQMKNGTLDLCDISRMNDALTVDDENMRRWRGVEK